METSFERLGVFEIIGSLIGDTALIQISSVSGQIGAYVNGFLIAATTIWFMVMGFAVMRGDLQTPFNKIVWEAVKKNLIFAIGLTGIYMSEIVVSINGFASGLMNVFASSFGGSCSSAFSGDPIGVYRALDCSASGSLNIVVAYFQAGIKRAGQIGLLNVGALIPAIHFFILGFFIAVGCLILYAMLGVEFMVAQISLILMLCLGPLAISCLAFEPTKKYFEGWLSKIIYCILIQAMIVLYIGLALKIITSFSKLAYEPILNQASSKGYIDVIIGGLILDPMYSTLIAIAFGLLLGVLGFVSLKISGITGALVGHQAQVSGLGAATAQMTTRGFKGAIGKLKK